MINLVPENEIESIVGRQRDAVRHIGLRRIEDKRVYIMHSQECKNSGIDLRDCVYSQALENSGWSRLPADISVYLKISPYGWLTS
jgi:hypothetical protein